MLRGLRALSQCDELRQQILALLAGSCFRFLDYMCAIIRGTCKFHVFRFICGKDVLLRFLSRAGEPLVEQRSNWWIATSAMSKSQVYTQMFGLAASRLLNITTFKPDSFLVFCHTRVEGGFMGSMFSNV